MNVKVEIVDNKIKVYHGLFLAWERRLIQKEVAKLNLKDGTHIVSVKEIV